MFTNLKKYLAELALNFVVQYISSSRVKELVLNLFSRLVVYANNTENKIDDYFVALVSREVEENWDQWFDFIIKNFQLAIVPNATAPLNNGQKEEPIYKIAVLVPEVSAGISYSFGGTEASQKAFLSEVASRLGVSSEDIISVLKWVFPILFQILIRKGI
ncbi:MAG: hypothetical protein LBJ67_05715 [Planctomycetaceae bacterium]|jgi:hypothetical protein|nr:hypothetical protein [Planctomycetaceae bacterium]